MSEAAPAETDRRQAAAPSARRSRAAARRYWLGVGAVLAAALWLRAPALEATLVSDDWDQYAMRTGIYPTPRAGWDLYRFTSAADADRREQLRSGRLPWWSDPEIQVAFLRPLSSLLMWVDQGRSSAPDATRAAHAQSLGWWLAGAILAAAVFQQLLPAAAAWLATVFYAVDDAHALPATWIASRAELIAVASMLGALWAQLRWKQSGRRGYRAASLALVWLGACSGEHALAVFGFLIAHALASESSWAARARTLAPLGAPFVLYLGVRAALGYGASGSLFYVDPFEHPARFASALARHIPLLLGDLTFGYAADYLHAGPPWRPVLLRAGVVPASWLEASVLEWLQWSVGLVALVAVAVGWVLARRLQHAAVGALRWLIAGSLLSLVPLASALPMTRLTIAPALAFHALFACAVVGAWTRMRSDPRLGARVLLGLAVALVLSLHGVRAAARSRALTEEYTTVSQVEQHWVARAIVDDATLPERHVITLSAIDGATRFSLPFVRHFEGQRMPRTSEVLLPPTFEPLEVIRVSDSVLELRSAGGAAFTEFCKSAYRDGCGFRPGEFVPSFRFAATVLAVEAGVPTHLRFRFARPLEDPAYLFMYPTVEGLRPITLPRPGSREVLPPPAWPRFLDGRP